MARQTRGSPDHATVPEAKKIDLGLQGGGAHGAYTWGVLDRLLEDGRLQFEGISGASPGTMNAVVLAHGLLEEPGHDSRERAREALHNFWLGISLSGLFGVGADGVRLAQWQAVRISAPAISGFFTPMK